MRILDGFGAFRGLDKVFEDLPQRLVFLSAGGGGDGLLVALKNAVDDDEEITRGQGAHEDADEALERREKPPGLCKQEIAVADRRIGDPRKVEG